MARLYEHRVSDTSGESVTVIDLDKVAAVQVEIPAGHHYPRVTLRFVDGHETGDVVPPASAHHFLDAYRAHLSGGPPPGTAGQ
jgi:hypothetical protein